MGCATYRQSEGGPPPSTIQTDEQVGTSYRAIANVVVYASVGVKYVRNVVCCKCRIKREQVDACVDLDPRVRDGRASRLEDN